MTTWVPVLLAASAAMVLTAVPRPGAARLSGLRPATSPARPPLAAAAPLLVLLLAGPVAAAVAVGGVVAGRRVAGVRRREAGVRLERARAVEALSLLAAELRAGAAPAQALAAAAEVATGPAGEALSAAAATASLGGDVPAALAVDDTAVPEVLRALAACWQVCSAAGSGLAAAVDRLAEGVRTGQAQRRAVDAELAGPRATAWLLAVLPVGGVGLAAALGAHPLHVLLHTALGIACLVGGLVLDGAGLLWTRRLVAGVATA